LENEKLRKDLKSMAQKMNKSIFTSIVLRVVNMFRAKCKNCVFLYETGLSHERRLLLSPDIVPVQYGETPTDYFSEWTDDFGYEAGSGFP
jgi:hypothetical protein